MHKRSIRLASCALMLLLLLSLFSPSLFVHAAEREVASRTPFIPDTSHLYFDDYLALALDELPAGFTEGEWQEDPIEGLRQEVFNSEDELSGYRFGHRAPDEVIVIRIQLIIATDTGERARIDRDMNRQTMNVMLSFPLDEDYGMKELIFDLAQRQIGYSYMDPDGAITELFVREEDGKQVSHYGGTYPGEAEATVRFVYDLNGELIESSIRRAGETADAPFDKTKNDDPVQLLWSSGFDIADHVVAAVFAGRFVPPTPSLEIEPFLALDPIELIPGWRASEWQDESADTIRRELYNEDGVVGGEQFAAAETRDDPAVLRTEYAFSLQSGERLKVILSPLDAWFTIVVEWPDGVFDGVKSLRFAPDGRQLGYVVYGTDGVQYGYLVEAFDDHFRSVYVQTEGASPDYDLKVLKYHYNPEGEFIGGSRHDQDAEMVAVFDEQPPTDIVKSLWLTGEDITASAVEPLVHGQKTMPLILPSLP